MTDHVAPDQTTTTPPDADAKPKAVAKRRRYGFVKGKCPNPGGRPRKDLSVAEIARSILGANECDCLLTFPPSLAEPAGSQKRLQLKSDKPFIHALVIKLMTQGLSGNVQATQTLFERAFGKVKDVVDLNNNMSGGADCVVTFMVARKRDAEDVIDGDVIEAEATTKELTP